MPTMGTMMQKKIDDLWDKMWDLKDRLDLESQFSKLAETNPEMQELWSEYSMLKGTTIWCGKDSGITASPSIPSKKEYFRRRELLALIHEATNEWSEPLFVCTACGGGARRKEDYVSDSYPPYFVYRCDKCGWQDIHV